MLKLEHQHYKKPVGKVTLEKLQNPNFFGVKKCNIYLDLIVLCQ